MYHGMPMVKCESYKKKAVSPVPARVQAMRENMNSKKYKEHVERKRVKKMFDAGLSKIDIARAIAAKS